MKTRGYKPGDRVYWCNSFNQDFYATVLRVIARLGLLVVKVDGDTLRPETTIDLDDTCRYRSWHK